MVNCGDGIDTAYLDFKDVIEDDSCEVVERRAPNRADSRERGPQRGRPSQQDCGLSQHS